MTNERAVEILKAYKQRLEASCSNQLDADIDAFDMAIKLLLKEQRPKGKWQESWEPTIGGTIFNGVFCSACHSNGCKSLNNGVEGMKFCPFCGADMGGSEEK